MWLGPVLYTFSCKMNVDFFPFDEQVSMFKGYYIISQIILAF